MRRGHKHISIKQFIAINNSLDGLPCEWAILQQTAFNQSPHRSAAGGVVDGGAAYEKSMSEEMTKLQRLYGGGDLAKFPDFKFQGVCVCVCVPNHRILIIL